MPTRGDASAAALRARLDQLSAQGKALEAEGLPFPTAQIRESVESALATGATEQANRVLKGGETLYAKVARDWTWVRELLRRADELRSIGATLGVDVEHLDSRVGNPRTRLQTDPLSSGSLEKAAASASLALAVLNDAIPKFCLQEAQNLGESIRRARNRGEEVGDASRALSRFLQALQEQNLPLTAQRLVETRRAVSRIPRAPALPPSSPHEEEEILREARNLARRLQRIKGKARDAQSAVRLMSQVRAVLSDDRRGYGTPEEEIEALWLEVDRITRERKLALEGKPLAPVPSSPPPPPGEVAEDEEPLLPSPLEAGAEANGPIGPDDSGAPDDDDADEGEDSAADEETPRQRSVAFVPYDPYIPPPIPGVNEPATDWDPNAARARKQASRQRP